MKTFEKELKYLINKHSVENITSMPDYITADMLCRIIRDIGSNIKHTLAWHGCDPGNMVCMVDEKVPEVTNDIPDDSYQELQRKTDDCIETIASDMYKELEDGGYDLSTLRLHYIGCLKFRWKVIIRTEDKTTLTVTGDDIPECITRIMDGLDRMEDRLAEADDGEDTQPPPRAAVHKEYTNDSWGVLRR